MLWYIQHTVDGLGWMKIFRSYSVPGRHFFFPLLYFIARQAMEYASNVVNAFHSLARFVYFPDCAGPLSLLSVYFSCSSYAICLCAHQVHVHTSSCWVFSVFLGCHTFILGFYCVYSDNCFRFFFFCRLHFRRFLWLTFTLNNCLPSNRK